ncbi:hypothetical protein [Pontibacter arcticus]|uniref:Uncharacterized protein n=1 Tax=Pontibacter arcticus TaxID=2080288 RepID=A0A364RGW9_9BACT|nr:hypothetical protein [Pontibacter arcticus]RAU83523.1 hypothetical protein DP923_00105 [Pontibacter arcticus]
MKKFIHKFLFTVVVAIILSFTTTEVYSQCAMCRATVESNVGTGSKEPESEVGSGLNTGILYLMTIPYILIGTFGFLWYKYSRKKA